MAVTVQYLCSCLVHAQAERELCERSSHYIQDVSDMYNSFKPCAEKVWTCNTTLSRARTNGVAQSTPEKPFSSDARGVKNFRFFISDLPVIAFAVDDHV